MPSTTHYEWTITKEDCTTAIEKHPINQANLFSAVASRELGEQVHVDHFGIIYKRAPGEPQLARDRCIAFGFLGRDAYATNYVIHPDIRGPSLGLRDMFGAYVNGRYHVYLLEAPEDTRVRGVMTNISNYIARVRNWESANRKPWEGGNV